MLAALAAPDVALLKLRTDNDYYYISIWRFSQFRTCAQADDEVPMIDVM